MKKRLLSLLLTLCILFSLFPITVSAEESAVSVSDAETL